MIVKLIILFIFIVMCYPASGADFYVSTSGSGSTCSKVSPCAPADIPWTTVDDEESTVYLFGGTYTNQFTITHAATNRLYIKPCSASPSPTECSTEVIFKVSSGSPQISLAGKYITLDGETTSGSSTRNMTMDFTNLPDNGHGMEWAGTGANYINNTIRWMTFKNATDTLHGQTKHLIYAPIVDGTEIAYNYFYNNACHDEIQAWSSTAAYGQVLIHDNIATIISINFLSGGKGVDFYNNTIDVTGSQEPYDIIHYYSNDSPVQYFRIYNNYFKTTGQSVFLENKTTETYPTQHIRIFNNIFIDSLGGDSVPILFHMGNTGLAWDDIIIANNTFLSAKFGVVGACYPGKTCTIGTTAPFRIVNNIFYETVVGDSTGFGPTGTYAFANAGDFEFDYNLMYAASGLKWEWVYPSETFKTYTSLSTWNTDHATQNHNPASSDPLFVSSSDFRLQVASPAKDTGIDLSGVSNMPAFNGVSWPYDRDGVARTGTWDIGAYEYAAGATGTTLGSGGSLSIGAGGTITFGP